MARLGLFCNKVQLLLQFSHFFRKAPMSDLQKAGNNKKPHWHPGDEGLDPNRWLALIVIAIAALMIVLDASIINLAIPKAQVALHISNANRQWVVTAYSLAFGSLLLLGGRIADYVGRKKVFIIGLLGFAGASAIGGFSTTQGMLFAARGLQGAFGALLAPAALSLINVTFTVPKERARAFGVYGAISGGGAAIGLIAGGTLTEYANWRWCLFVNIPIAIIAVFLAIPNLHESKAAGDNKYDIPGAVTVTLGLVSLVYGFSQAANNGWVNIHTYPFFIIAVLFIGAFLAVEVQVKNPLLPLRVVRERNRGGSYMTSLLLGTGLFAMFLFLSIYLQNFLHYSPLKSGFAFLPFSGGIIIGAGIASQLLPRVGPRPLMASGAVVAAGGLWLLSGITPTSGYTKDILPAIVIMSFGAAFVFIPSASTGLHNSGEHDAGVASAMLNTSQQIGGSLGAALLNTVAISSAAAYIKGHASLGKNVAIYGQVHGFSTTFKIGAGFLLAAALVSAIFINAGKDSLTEQSA
jgi:EmrB/QacA subfamily drug resistance transporter